MRKERQGKQSKAIDLVHSYVIGPLPTPSYGGSRYVLTFIGDFSRYCCVYFLKLKSEVFETLKVWKALIDNACGNDIKVLMSENGKDYVKNSLKQLCEECASKFSSQCPTHLNRKVLQSARTRLSRRWLPI